jgi:hypothetical protein
LRERVMTEEKSGENVGEEGSDLEDYRGEG